MDRQKREGVASRLLTHLKYGGRPAMVGRQLRNGDLVLVNRQVSAVAIVYMHFEMISKEEALVMHHSEY
jgi:hypothetical protein